MTEPENPFLTRLEDLEKRMLRLEEHHQQYWGEAWLTGKVISCGTMFVPAPNDEQVYQAVEHIHKHPPFTGGAAFLAVHR